MSICTKYVLKKLKDGGECLAAVFFCKIKAYEARTFCTDFILIQDDYECFEVLLIDIKL